MAVHIFTDRVALCDFIAEQNAHANFYGYNIFYLHIMYRNIVFTVMFESYHNTQGVLAWTSHQISIDSIGYTIKINVIWSSAMLIAVFNRIVDNVNIYGVT